ncbi:hypothetical protein B0H19DRAFT_958017, partial [Mycena capillaripes]
SQQFTSVTADDACTFGDEACGGSSLADCVNGKYVLSRCDSDKACVAVPNLDSAGTSIDCLTPAARDAQFLKSGVAFDAPMAPPPFDQKQNGDDANELNKQFLTLKPGDPCTFGDLACTEGAPAICENGKYVKGFCNPGQTCFAIPNIGFGGTDTDCLTPAQRDAEFLKVILVISSFYSFIDGTTVEWCRIY